MKEEKTFNVSVAVFVREFFVVGAGRQRGEDENQEPDEEGKKNSANYN